MPIYKVQAPNGQIYKVEAPEGATEDQLFGFVSSQLMNAEQKKPEDVGIVSGTGAALKRGLESFGDILGGYSLAGSKVVDDLESAQRKMEAFKEEARKPVEKPSLSFSDLQRVYEQKGLGAALANVPKYATEMLAESGPQMAAPLAAGAAATPFVGPVGGTIAGVGTYFLQQFGNQMQRQALEKEKAEELDVAKAATASALQAPIGYFADKFTAGLGGLGERGVIQVGKELAARKAAGEIGAAGVAAGVGKQALKGATAGFIAEAPTEALEQVLERWQAGLPITGKEANEEYLNAFMGAGMLGVVGGGGSRAMATYGLSQQQPEKETQIPEEVKVEDIMPLPKGFSVERQTLEPSVVPQTFNITMPGAESPLASYDTEQEAQEKLPRLQQIRQDELATVLREIEDLKDSLQKKYDRLDYLEATGQTQTEEYQSLKANIPNLRNETDDKIGELFKRQEEYQQPLQVQPFGEREQVNEQFVLRDKAGKEIGAFPSMEAATAALREQVGEKAFAQAQERAEQMKELHKQLVPALQKFGLKDVGLKIVEDMEFADGRYSNKLVEIALKQNNPLQTLRHEAVHALKDMGFFTPQQWRALEERAKKEWIKTHLEGQQTEIDGKPMSRLEGYKAKGYSEQDIIEEAIADAFAAYDKGEVPPPGLIASLYKKLKNFFANFGQALRGAGFESADDIFQKIERGELKPSLKVPVSATTGEIKQSLAPVPLSTRDIMESNPEFAQTDLGLATTKKKGATGANNVRDIALALNNKTLAQERGIDRNNTSHAAVKKIARAVADEVGWQLRSSSKTGTGLGWYSNNYPNALKKLGDRFPELKTSDHARSVFSALVAVTSNGEDVTTNIHNAISLYEKLRMGKKIEGIGARRATALENNLQQIEDLLDRFGTNFKNELLKEITVADMNAYLRSVGEKPSGDYLAHTKVPAAAIYFGPKLGAFYANLMGAEGYLTMDMWWTRSINRMRGLLKPQATESSINNFRDLMDKPDATREEVVQAAIPFKQKYEDHGYVTDLEFLAKGKEPREKAGLDAWMRKAKRNAGDAFDQLYHEHKMEKAANTIYKNEFEMLEEAPFNASDRKFMYDIARTAQQDLRKEGVNLSIADIQAALWYYEKRLYAKLSGRKADDIGYEEAILSSAREVDRPARPSVVFSGEPHRWNVAPETISVSDRLGGEGKQEKLSLKGVMAEVAPNPDHIAAEKWREMTPKERLDATRAVANKIMNPIFDELGLKGFTYTFSSGKYEGEINPNIIIEAPEDATIKQLDELARVTGYVLDQKSMVTFDESNKSSGSQSAFVKVVIPEDMDEETMNNLREHIAREVPQAEGDSLRDGALLFGNFSDLSDAQYEKAIVDAIGSFDYDGKIRVSNVEKFHSDLVWPDSRDDYLKETRYGAGREIQREAGTDVRGQGRGRVEALAEQAIALRDRWIDSRGAARLGGRERSNSQDFGKPTSEYGTPVKDATSAVGVHFSRQERPFLDSGFFGTGLRGLENKRLEESPDLRQRLYFYVDKGQGIRPEAGVGGVPHVIQLNNLYDADADPRGFIKNNRGATIEERTNNLERKINDAGFDGILVRDNLQSQGYAILYGRHTIPTKKLSLKTSFATPEAAERAAYKKSPPSTPQFKQWFGASKIMEEGRPQVMYHASPNEFETFSEYKPIFISPDAEKAQQFSALKRLGRGVKRDYIYPLWVRAETPFDYENSDHVNTLLQELSPTMGMNEFIETEKEIKRGNWSKIEDTRTQAALKKIGFDSFYVKEGGAKNLAVFSGNQVKSVTGNIGEFSTESKSIKYSLPSISQGAKDAINRVTSVREQKGFMNRILDALSPKNYAYYRQQALNRYEALSMADKIAAKKLGITALTADQSAEMAALMSDLHSGVAASVFGIQGRRGGVPVLRNGITTVDHSKKGLVAVLAPLAKYGDAKVFQYFQFYSAVKRGHRLFAEGRERLITPADQQHANELLQKFPEFEAVRKDWVTFNDAITDYLKETGVLSAADAAKFKQYADYIPFYRQLEGDDTLGPNIFQSLSGVKKPKKLEGGTAPLADFMETIVRNTHAAITAGMKNQAEMMVIKVGKQAGYVNDIAPGAHVGEFEKIKVLINGVKHEYQCQDPLFVDATRSLHMPDLPFMSFLSAPANLLRNVVTREPGFIMTNLLRDSVSAYVTSGANITPVAGTVINFAKAMKGQSPEFEALMDAGIIGGYEFSANIEQSGAKLTADLMKKAGKGPALLKPFTSLWDGLESATTASDAATRMAVYERVLAETGNEAEALARALEVMNFNRKGSSGVVRILTAAVPFLNARMQGLDVFYRAMTGKMNTTDAKEIQRKFFARGMMIMGLSTMYYFAVAGNPDYEKQEQETKDNNWIVPGAGIRIPIPFEVGILFKTIPERIAAYSFGNDTGKDFLEAMNRAANGFIPISPSAYIPQTFKPIIEAMTNYNFFTQREIVGMGLKDVDPKYQVGPGTSAFAEFVGKTLGLSPLKVDHVFKGYTGSMGMYAVDLMDSVMELSGDSPKPTKRFEQMPIIKRFALDPEARGNVTNYYQLKDSVDTAVRTMNLLEKSGDPQEFAKYVQENAGLLAFKSYVSDLEKSMKELRDMRKQVLNSDMTGDQKRDINLAIGQAENNLSANIQTVKKVIDKL